MEEKEKIGLEELQIGALPLDVKLRQAFDGKIVRKDLTKKIKEGANVPVYVLEFLLGQYCNFDRTRPRRYCPCCGRGEALR